MSHLKWNMKISIKKIKKNTINILNIFLEINWMIVKFFKIYWLYVKNIIYELINCYLKLNYFL